MKIQAAVVWEKGAPFSVEAVELEPPRPTEVIVRVRAVGICHTDLLARDGLYPTPHPLVCGHEGAGVVEQTGASVTKVKPGDHVVLTFVWCGHCQNCLRGQRPYCDDMFRLNFGGVRADGSTPISQDGRPIHAEFMGQSSFATHAIVEERSLVRVSNDVPFHLLAPLGCSVQTGAGAVLNSLQPPVGSSIAIFGSGGVGLCALMAARVAGCWPIIVADLRDARLELATRFGASHTINAGEVDAVEAIKEITGGGVQYSLEVTGDTGVFRQAVHCLRETGTCGLVGAAPYGAEGKLDMTTVLRGRNIRGIIYGDSVPDLFIPLLIELQRRGQLPYEQLIERFPFEEINAAAAASESGQVIKSVLELGG